MFLPEGVRFDEQCCVDVGGKRLLQCSQHWLHTVPFTSSHVHNHCESTSTHILTDRKTDIAQTRVSSSFTFKVTSETSIVYLVVSYASVNFIQFKKKFLVLFE